MLGQYFTIFVLRFLYRLTDFARLAKTLSVVQYNVNFWDPKMCRALLIIYLKHGSKYSLKMTRTS